MGFKPLVLEKRPERTLPSSDEGLPRPSDSQACEALGPNTVISTMTGIARAAWALAFRALSHEIQSRNRTQGPEGEQGRSGRKCFTVSRKGSSGGLQGEDVSGISKTEPESRSGGAGKDIPGRLPARVRNARGLADLPAMQCPG